MYYNSSHEHIFCRQGLNSTAIYADSQGDKQSLRIKKPINRYSKYSIVAISAYCEATIHWPCRRSCQDHCLFCKPRRCSAWGCVGIRDKWISRGFQGSGLTRQTHYKHRDLFPPVKLWTLELISEPDYNLNIDSQLNEISAQSLCAKTCYRVRQTLE